MSLPDHIKIGLQPNRLHLRSQVLSIVGKFVTREYEEQVNMHQ